MSGGRLMLVWAVCVLLGALSGCLLGYLIWQLGFELLGSAVTLVGAGVGGILAFFGFLSWNERQEASRRKSIDG
jgi:hypothetical protein